MHRKLGVATFCYLAFVIYGSLVPLSFESIPFSLALNRFANIPFLELGVESRADWVANGLLFIPLAFLAIVIVYREHHLGRNIFWSLVIVVLAFLLSVLIEFTQLFFPNRTVSQNDIIAETIGGVAGVLGCWLFYKQFTAFVERWLKKGFGNSWQLYLTVYLFCMFAYSVMPLDLTISPIEIYHKWKNGLVEFVPFAFLVKDPLYTLYYLGTDVLIWVPVALLWLKSGQLTPREVVLRVLASATIIEFCQLFVFSRSSDINDIITAGLGAYVGVLVFAKFSKKERNPLLTASGSNKVSVVALLCFVSWLLVLSVIYCYPFNFDFSNRSISDSLSNFFSVPFASYYAGTEYRALTELFRKILFAAPLGVIFAFGLKGVIKLSSRTRLVLVGFSCFAVLFFLEFLQIFVPGRTANFTDVMLGAVGAVGAYKVCSALLLRLNEQPQVRGENFSFVGSHETENQLPADTKGESSEASALSLVAELNRKNYLLLTTGMLTVGLMLFFVSQANGVPYNVKELLSGHWYQPWGFSLVLFLTLGFPLAAVNWAINHNYLRIFMLILLSLTHTLLVWGAVRFFVPKESIFDVIGSPTWGVVSELEMLFRFSGLMLILSGAAFGVAVSLLSKLQALDFHLKMVGVVWWTLYLFISLPVSFMIVIAWSGTDNLIELLPNSGYSFKTLAWVGYFIMFVFLGSYLSIQLHRRSLLKTVMVTAIIVCSTPLAYWFVKTGTEQLVFKYDRIFSALQFLLSADRESYLAPEKIFLRFCLAHLGLVMIFVLAQWHFWMPSNKKTNA